MPSIDRLEAAMRAATLSTRLELEKFVGMEAQQFVSSFPDWSGLSEAETTKRLNNMYGDPDLDFAYSIDLSGISGCNGADRVHRALYTLWLGGQAEHVDFYHVAASLQVVKCIRENMPCAAPKAWRCELALLRLVSHASAAHRNGTYADLKEVVHNAYRHGKNTTYQPNTERQHAE